MSKKTLLCGGKILSLESPKVMGILNVGSNSFYDGGKYNSKQALFDRVEQMKAEGVDIVDVGVTSSKPGEKLSLPKVEIESLSWLKELVSKYPELFFSIDTYHSSVARFAVESGVHIVNDISGGEIDSKMLQTVGELKVPYIAMHMKGQPDNMQENPYSEDVAVESVFNFFKDKLIQARAYGVQDVVIDPGFGFGKDLKANFKLLEHLKMLEGLGVPVLAGLSRKSMIYKVIDSDAEGALCGTAALNIIALQNGAKILRVHDVKAAKDIVKLYEFMVSA